MGTPTECHVEPFGLNSLQLRQLVDIAADLQDRAGLDVPRQLRVGDLVVKRAVDAWPIRRFAAQQEVGVPPPPAIEEGGLVDDLRAGCHRLDRPSAAIRNDSTWSDEYPSRAMTTTDRPSASSSAR